MKRKTGSKQLWVAEITAKQGASGEDTYWRLQDAGVSINLPFSPLNPYYEVSASSEEELVRMLVIATESFGINRVRHFDNEAWSEFWDGLVDEYPESELMYWALSTVDLKSYKVLAKSNCKSEAYRLARREIASSHANEELYRNLVVVKRDEAKRRTSDGN